MAQASGRKRSSRVACDTCSALLPCRMYKSMSNKQEQSEYVCESLSMSARNAMDAWARGPSWILACGGGARGEGREKPARATAGNRSGRTEVKVGCRPGGNIHTAPTVVGRYFRSESMLQGCAEG